MLAVAFLLVVASFFLGRVSSKNNTFLAASETDPIIQEQQKETLFWLKESDPLNFANYRIAYLKVDFDESSGAEELVPFFAGKYRIPGKTGYYHIDASGRGDLDGDGVEEGAAVKLGNFGGTGHFPELVVLKKTGLEYTEIASTSEPYSFFADRIDAQSVQVLDQTIIVKIMGVGPEDGACCPTMPMEMEFRFVNGQIAKI